MCCGPRSCASCTAPGVTLGRLPSCGFVTERTVGYDGLLVRRSWWRGCVLIQLPPFGRTGLRLCLASGEACRAPHMSNLSVPVHKSVLREAGFSEEYAVLHWIGSLALLSVCGDDVPVCGAYRAWRFGCVHPGALAGADATPAGALDADCSLFESVLQRCAATPGRRFAGNRRVHVLPAIRAVDSMFPDLDAALEHPDSLFSVHVTAKDRGAPVKRLQKALGADAVLEVLGKSDKWLDLTLPQVWVLPRKAKDSHVCSVGCPFVGIVWHEPTLRGSLATAVRDRLRSFLFAASSPVARGSARVCTLAPALCWILSGRHWVSKQRLPACLAYLGFLPAGWALMRDLLPRQKGRAMQKAHELICWWRMCDRITRRRSMAAELHASYAGEADERSPAELRFLRSGGFMLATKRSEPSECTHALAGAAPDEVVSSWSINPRVCMRQLAA